MGDFLAALGALAGGAAPGVERGMARRRERRQAEARKKEGFEDWMRKFGVEQEAKKEMFGLQQEAKERQFGIQQEAKRRQVAEAEATKKASMDRFLEMAGVDPRQASQDPELAMRIAMEIAAGGDGTKATLEYGAGVAARRRAEDQARAQAAAAAGDVPLPEIPQEPVEPPEPGRPPRTPIPPELEGARETIEAWEEETGKSFEETWRRPEIRKLAATMPSQAPGPLTGLFGVEEAAMKVEGPLPRTLRAYQQLMRAGYGPGGKPWRRPSKAARKKYAAERRATAIFKGKQISREKAIEKFEMAERSLAERQQGLAAELVSGGLTGTARREAVEKWMPEIADDLEKMERVHTFFKGMNEAQILSITNDEDKAKELVRRFGLKTREELEDYALAKFEPVPEREEEG